MQNSIADILGDSVIYKIKTKPTFKNSDMILLKAHLFDYFHEIDAAKRGNWRNVKKELTEYIYVSEKEIDIPSFYEGGRIADVAKYYKIKIIFKSLENYENERVFS